MAAADPRITITLVTFNGMRWLRGCLASVRAQTCADYELVVLDNASSDGTRQLLRDAARADPRVSVIESDENLGFARAHNRLILGATAEFVLLLNQDVELDPEFLNHALAAFEGRPRVAAVQGRLLRLEGPGKRVPTVDSTGLVMNRDRRAVSRGQGEHDDGLYHAGPVFGADGPAPIYRQAALRDAREPRTGGGWEVLDEDFFMYKEDVDLAWRLRRLGWEAWYEPDAVAWHARGAGGPRAITMLDIARTNRTIPGWVKQISWRNQRLMQVKNEEIGAYAADFPWIVRRELLSLAFILLADPLRLRILPSLLRTLPGAMHKRRYLSKRLRGPRPFTGDASGR